MIEPAIILIRLAQYVGAAMLFGSAAFHLYSSVAENAPDLARRTRALLAAGAALLAVGAFAAIAAQSIYFAGTVKDGLAGESLAAVALQMDFGKAALVRASVAAAALVALTVVAPGRPLWLVATTLGGLATVTLAWMGHAGAGEGESGRILLASDVLHLLAAAGWLGALIVFVQMLFVKPDSPVMVRALHTALHRFAILGSVFVAIIVITGVVNTVSIVGLDGIKSLATIPYGRLLFFKLAIFAAMLGLAALNRFRLTPALGSELANAGPSQHALRSLRRSVVLETLAGAAVLLLVAWLGTLAPVA